MAEKKEEEKKKEKDNICYLKPTVEPTAEPTRAYCIAQETIFNIM